MASQTLWWGPWELSFDPSDPIVPVGEHGMPKVVTVSHPGGGLEPLLRLEIQVWNGTPVCSKVELIGKSEAGAQVRVKHLKTLAGVLEDLVEQVCVNLGFDRNGDTGWTTAFPLAVETQRSRRRAVSGSRRKITRQFLERVAAVYRDAEAPRLDAVAVEFDCSERSAARYVAKAREAGLLDG